MLLTDLFARPSLNFIFGTLASKKTWLALDLAVSVALGRRWLGQGKRSDSVLRGAERQRGDKAISKAITKLPTNSLGTPVLFLDEDHGLSEFSRRLRSVLQAYRAPPGVPIHFSSFARYDLADSRDAANLIATAKKVNAGLIIIDNPSISLPLGKREGWGGGFLSALSNLRLLAQTANAAVLVLHHTRQRRTGLAPLLLAFGVDHVLAVDSPFGQSWLHLRTVAAANQPPVSLTAQLRLAQARFGKIIHDAHFRGLSPASLPPSPLLGQAGLAVLRFLDARGASTSSQILASVHAAVPGRLLHVIHELLKDGYLRRTNPGGKGVPALYALTPAGSVQVAMP